ncbi:MAG: hypothetical protein IJ834_07635 [Paludibacteraceae bacterium]|nr:hypothetical protein [Paludibacteraceae bacterium]
MERKVNTILNCYYYGFYLLAIITAIVMWQGVTKEFIPILPKDSTLGLIVQYIVIFYTIISVAGGLYCFKKAIDKVRNTDDKEKQLLTYKAWGIARICVIGFGIALGIATFYWMGGYRSMLWCGAVSTIALYFCKPTLRKMELELATDNTEQLNN